MRAVKAVRGAGGGRKSFLQAVAAVVLVVVVVVVVVAAAAGEREVRRSDMLVNGFGRGEPKQGQQEYQGAKEQGKEKKHQRGIGERLRESSAFSLAETLVATMLLLLAALIMTTGIPAARNAYEKVVLAANSQVLLSTTIATLRNELSTARNIRCGQETFENPVPGEGEVAEVEEITTKTITYYSAIVGAPSRIYIDPGEENPPSILFQRYAKVGSIGKNMGATRLISAPTATENMYVTYADAEYTQGSGIIRFKDLAVKQGEREIIPGRDISIRVIAG